MTGEFHVQQIMKHIGSSGMMKYITPLYGYGPAAGNTEPVQHISQHFIVRLRSGW